jgi:hypothetical protein
VSRGASRQTLAERSGIDPLKLSDPGHRIRSPATRLS